MVSVEEARARVLEGASRLGEERVSLDEAEGRVLAEDVRAPGDLPAFDHSMMDGYAVSVGDLPASGPWRLPVVGESRAGSPAPELARGTACRIFTGAPLPARADAVVLQENVTRTGDVVELPALPKAGANLRRRGEDLAAGAVALAAGTRLYATHLALLASVERAWSFVARRPVVTILATGDELRPPGTPGGPATIADSNSFALAAAARRAGAHVRVAPTVGDDAGASKHAVARALVSTDVLVTVGGASVGDHDLVKPSLVAAGCSIDFHKVAMKPGKPLLLGRRGETRILGLPGNPISAMLTFALFGLPLLRALQGASEVLPKARKARFGGALKRAPGRAEFLRVRLQHDANGVVAEPLAQQASNALPSFAAADALVCLAAETTEVRAGDDVEILLLRELGL